MMDTHHKAIETDDGSALNRGPMGSVPSLPSRYGAERRSTSGVTGLGNGMAGRVLARRSR
jgi:hypothetical protein